MNDTERRRFLQTALAGTGLALTGTAMGQETTTEDDQTTTAGGQTTTPGGETTTEAEETTPGGEETTTPPPETDSGLVTVESDADFDTTVRRIETAIEDDPDLIFVTSVDHARNARAVGADLRPTRLVVFGNPNLGTELMLASQTAGIDLPQKLLVWEGEDGTVNVTYNDPQWVAERHDIEGQDEILTQIAGALEALATGG